jgi:hypothetical protein
MRARMMMAAVAALVLLPAGCSHRTPTERDLFNVDAALPARLPVEPLEWRVITSSIDREHHTMATLFGNDVAVTSARSATGSVTYPVGSTVALVTWVQKDDGHWFGARIPQRFVSMELGRWLLELVGRRRRGMSGSGWTDDLRIRRIRMQSGKRRSWRSGLRFCRELPPATWRYAGVMPRVQPCESSG